MPTAGISVVSIIFGLAVLLSLYLCFKRFCPKKPSRSVQEPRGQDWRTVQPFPLPLPLPPPPPPPPPPQPDWRVPQSPPDFHMAQFHAGRCPMGITAAQQRALQHLADSQFSDRIDDVSMDSFSGNFANNCHRSSSVTRSVVPRQAFSSSHLMSSRMRSPPSPVPSDGGQEEDEKPPELRDLTSDIV